MKELKSHFISSISSIREAISVIDKTSSQIALVVKNGYLEAVVTDGDIRRALLRGETLDNPVKNIMCKNFIFLPEMATEKEALTLMKVKSLKQIPILDKERRVIKLILLDELIKPERLPNDVVIMVGGEGKRLGLLTKNCPKPMLKINGKHILEIILEQCIDAGFVNFYFSVNYLKEQIKNYFQDGLKWNVRINYLEEDKPLGTAGSLSLLPTQMKNDPTLILNGDILTKIDYNSLIQFHKNNNADISLCASEYRTNIPYGVISIDDKGIPSLNEKPNLKYLINAGIYLLEPIIFNLIPKNNFFDMPELIKKAKEKKYKVNIFPIHEYWKDIGYPEGLLKTTKDWI
jgi:dTDP-glucose pyrophosphorylase/predicted transcriptional regulator